MAELQFETLGDGPRVAWILHGILGSGRNWRTFARSLLRDDPSWRFVLPDLRNHGQTGPVPGPHRLPDCAADLGCLPTPEKVIGHSFGGKVAMSWAQTYGAGQPVWVLDSVPFADRAGDSQVIQVLAALDTVVCPAPERADLRAQLEATGLASFLIDWLLTSTRQDADGWRFVYDLAAIRQMLTSYLTTDFGTALEHWSGTELHLVRAERSERWRAPWVERLEALDQAGVIGFHLLPNAGHWVQVDNPTGLQALLRG